MRVHRRILGAIAFPALAVGIALGVSGVPTQEATLVASDGVTGDDAGTSVAIDGDTALVGADGVGPFFTGAAYVFTRSGTTWTQEQKLTAADAAAGQTFGQVALSGDTALVGAQGADVNRGAAYVFTRTGTTWTQQAKLTGADVVDTSLVGSAVALSGDTAIAGSYLQNGQQGAAYVFTRTGTTWTQQQKLTAADGQDLQNFGSAVAVSGDTAIVGAYAQNSSRGAVYVFTRTGTTWAQQQKFAPSDSAVNDAFGFTVALSGDTAVVASLGRNQAQGAVYVFTRAGTTWTEQQKLLPPDVVSGNSFGVSLAIDGDTAVAGAFAQNSNRGAAYVFTRTGTTWTQRQKLTVAHPAAGDFFGDSVAVDGDAALVGATDAGVTFGNPTGPGSAYVFDLAGPPPGYCLASKVKAKVSAASPAKSSLTVSGTLDTGGGVPGFSGAATFDAGGFHLAVPAFVAKGRSLSYAADGMSLKITPAKNGSSRATFAFKAVGDLTGKAALDGPLALRYVDAANDLIGTAILSGGVLGPRAVGAPPLSVVKAAATVKGGGKDALKLTLAFVPVGGVPAAGEDLTISFGGAYTSPLLSGSSFVRKGDAWVGTSKAPGITKVTVDYAKGAITIAGKGLDLGTFAAGGNAVAVTVTRGADTRSVAVRMALAGTKLAY